MKKQLFTTLLTCTIVQSLLAQGAIGIDAASSEIGTYIDPVANFILIVGAVVGLIGGVRVFIKWNSGDQDVQKSIMGWFGSCLFLVTVGIVIKAFFGV
jgi:hypothetical protein